MATDDKPFSCTACGAKFSTRKELDEHNKQKHPELTPAGQAGRRQ